MLSFCPAPSHDDPLSTPPLVSPDERVSERVDFLVHMDILDLTLDDEDDSTPPTPTPTPPRPIPRPPPPPPPVPQRRPEVEEGRKVREPIKTSPTIARSVQASGSGLKNGGGSSGRRSGASTVGEAANKTLPKKMEMLELSGDSDSEMEIGGREKVKRLSTAAAATAPRGINQVRSAASHPLFNKRRV